ncbi:MFS transporter [Cytobacillus sp. Hz8]|uniref:MFS transporter n=1 Tax=Cytobacillus sp. Hz8 TaxID=3347168 RepID=UPI0035D5FEA5
MSHLNPRLWTKDFIIVSSINFFLTLVFYLLMVTISVFAVDEFHASTSEAGLVTGIFIIGALVGRLATGRIIDSVGRKKILIVGLILFTLATLLYFGINSLSFLLANRFVHGIALGIGSTATGTIVAQVIPEARRGEGVGYYSLSATLATAIGPFVGLYLSQHTNFHVIFIFCVALGIISLLTSFILQVPNLSFTEEKTGESKGFKFTNFVETKALPIAFVTLVAGFCYSSVMSFITFYAMEIHLVDAASFFFLVYAVAILVSRPFTGRLFDLKGANMIMYPALFIFAIGMLLLSTANHGIILLIAGAVIGFGFGNFQSSAQAVAIKVTPAHRMGLATSTFFIFIDVGYGIGPYLLGFMIPLTGYRGMYVTMGICALATIILYHFMHGKKETAEKRSRNVSVSL